MTRRSEMADQIASLKLRISEQEKMTSALSVKLDGLRMESKGDDLDALLRLAVSKLLKIKGQEEKIIEQEKQISVLNVELDKLRMERESDDLGQLVRLAASKGADIGVKRQKVVFEFSLGNMAAFLTPSIEKRETKGEFFFCGNRAWSVEVLREFLWGGAYLSVYLRATDFANDSADWSTKADFKVTLLNSCSSFDVSKSYTNLKFSKSSACWGWNKFIKIGKLRSDAYIKNDEIKFQVDLQIKKSTPANSSARGLGKKTLFILVLVVVINVLIRIAIVCYRREKN